MFIQFLEKMLNINDTIFGIFDSFIESLAIADYLKDAICDSVHLIPFLFLIFVLIELFETYFTYKIKDISKYSTKIGPLLGAILASLPQCGFSVIATPLYIRRVISRGTLIAIYISTSDEAIPILLAEPAYLNKILPLLFIKIGLGIIIGYLVDLLFKQKEPCCSSIDLTSEHEAGCCAHHIKPRNIWEVFIHPAIHTVNIFMLILIISITLNYCFEMFGNTLFNKILLTNSIFQPVLASIIGLIPNCAVSVLLTMLYISGTLSFASIISGLSSSAGLGLIVLLRKNDSFKDSLKIISILLISAIASGIAISIILKLF